MQPYVELMFSNLFSPSEQANIQLMITNGDSNGVVNYAMSPKFLVPFIVIAAVFAIMFVIVICCCVFEKSCPPCDSWKRDFSRRPYEKNELRCVMGFAVGFSVAILITSIIAFAYFPAMQSDISNTKCSMYHSLDVAINGDQSNGWGGFAQLQNQIGNISSLLSSASSQVTSNLANNGWLISGMALMRQLN